MNFYGPGLPGEYRSPLVRLDTKYHGTQAGLRGPLFRKLEGHSALLCLNVGYFKEGSKNLHSLIEWLVDSKLESIFLA